jgi:hypothetical protein
MRHALLLVMGDVPVAEDVSAFFLGLQSSSRISKEVGLKR